MIAQKQHFSSVIMRLTGVIVLVLFAQTAYAQLPAKDAPNKDTPSYAASVDSTIATLYRVISGAAGVQRNWAQFRTLFHPSARLMPVALDSATKGFALRVMSTEDYITMAGKRLEARGFFEREIFRKTESYGQIVHAFSTYEARANAGDAKPFMRGINSIQLMNDGKRWWILSIVWDSERATTPIPAQYLPPATTK